VGAQANDWYLGDPYEIGFTDFAKTVPVMVGSVISEWGFAPHLKARMR
jgi:para-nitrobenzyl esterase